MILKNLWRLLHPYLQAIQKMISCVNLKVISSLIIILKIYYILILKKSLQLDGITGEKEVIGWKMISFLSLMEDMSIEKIYGITIWKRFYILHPMHR